MDCRIYESTMITRDGSTVSVGASHFDNKDWAEKYYGIVIRLIEAGKCARVKWNEDSIMSIENIDDLVLEKEVPEKKKFDLQIQPPNLEWTSDFHLEAISTPYVIQLSLILVNNIVIIIIIYQIFESSSHILKAYSNKNIITL